jgi:hypothetical protein
LYLRALSAVGYGTTSLSRLDWRHSSRGRSDRCLESKITIEMAVGVCGLPWAVEKCHERGYHFEECDLSVVIDVLLAASRGLTVAFFVSYLAGLWTGIVLVLAMLKSSRGGRC